MRRNTVQRQIVLNTLKKLNNHPAIDELYAEIHKEHPSISKTTVYRSLHMLADNGVIRQIALPDGLERYDASNVQHHHFRCKNCGKIFDVDIEYAANINELVRQKYGFQVDDHDVVFKGTCPHCAKE